MPRTILVSVLLALSLLVGTSRASAQHVDLTLFLGGAYPVYDERLTLRPSAPNLPGAEVRVTGSPELEADGGLVLGAALAFEAGVIGIEGRLDATDIGFNLTGARYDIRATMPPFEGLTGAVVVGDGRFDADTLYLLSLNLRLRTPGPVGIVASGGLSYLPEISVGGSVPVSLLIGGLPVLPDSDPRLVLSAAPGESDHRFGVNGGAGLRFGGGPVSVMAEVRAFYFREYELRFGVEDAPVILTEVLDSIDPIRFEPIIVNAQAGIVFRF